MKQIHKVLLVKTVMKLFIDVSQISQVKFSLTMSVQQNEMSFSAFISKRVSDFLCKLSDEPFEIESITVVSLIDLLNGSVYEFVLLLKT